MKSVLIIIAIAFSLPLITQAQDPGASVDVLNQLQGKRGVQMMKPEERKVPTEGNKEGRATQFEARKESLMQNVEMRKDSIVDQKNQLRQKLNERKIKVEERRTKLEEGVKAKVATLLGNVYERLSHILEKLSGFADRLNTKIDSLNTEGVDTGNAVPLLDTAREKINEAKVELEASKTILDSTLNTEVSKGDVRTVVDSVKSSIKSAHAALVDVIQEMKNLKSDKDVSGENKPQNTETSSATSTE